MLRAKSNTGEFITLALLTPVEIDECRKNQQFYCPVCEERLMIKAGTRVIPHFAHYSKVECSSYKGGEGAYHEKGKLYLYKWLKSQKLEVELEPYLQEIKQQPDLLLTLHDKKIAIEFQCARITIGQIQGRNEGYKRAGIIPIWILGANRLKRQGKYHLKVDQFTHQFIHQFSQNFPQRLFYFCPDILQLLTFQDMYQTSIRQAVGQLKFKKLYQMKFTDLFIKSPFLKESLYQLWKREKRKFRISTGKQLYGRELAWQQWLYLKQTHLEYLPSMIYLPISAQYRMKSSPWDWQSRLCLDIIDPLPVGNLFTFNRCKNLLSKHLHQQNYFPLIQSTKHPVHQYLHLLEQLQIIQRQSPEQFIKVGKIPFYNQIEQAVTGDEQMMDKLILANRNKIQA